MGGSSSKQREEEKRRNEEVETVMEAFEYFRLREERKPWEMVQRWREEADRAMRQAPESAILQSHRKRREETTEYARLQAERQRKEEADRVRQAIEHAKRRSEKKRREEAIENDRLQAERRRREEADRVRQAIENAKLRSEKKREEEAMENAMRQAERQRKEEADRVRQAIEHAKRRSEKKHREEAIENDKLQAERRRREEADRLRQAIENAKLRSEKKRKEEAMENAMRQAERQRKEEADRVRQAIEHAKQRSEKRRREEAIENDRLQAERRRREHADIVRQAIENAKLRSEKKPKEEAMENAMRQAERQRKEEADRVRQAIEHAKQRSEKKRREEAIENARLQAERKRREDANKVRHATEYDKLQAGMKQMKEATGGQVMVYPRPQVELQRQKIQQRRETELWGIFKREVVLTIQSLVEQEVLGRLKKHKVTKNLDLLNDFGKAFNLTPLSSYPDAPYTEKELLETSEEYIRASIVFKTSNKPLFTISKITRVDNMFHVLQYNLMKDKYQKCYDESSLSEMLMFHGTKMEFLESICTYNFDKSKVRNHRFGHGISFARDSYFATHYHQDNKQRYHKVMIITKMFWGRLDLGTEDMIIPSTPRYTSANNDKTVIVKYDDASYYPLYIVYYDGLHSTNENLHDVYV